MSDQVRYIFEDDPPTGTTREVAPGVHWLQMPLPFKLNHVNLWLLEDGDGWTVIDTGIARDEVRAAWERIFAARLAGRPVKRIIVTHFHPDHMGLAGWFAERFGATLWSTLSEWTFGRMLSLDDGSASLDHALRFYGAAGFDGDLLDVVRARGNSYRGRVVPPPAGYRRIRHGETIPIGGREWQVIVGGGHSPEHASLWCRSSAVLIAGDQVLPKISPNVSVWPQEPEADPLTLYLDSLERFRWMAAATLVLPSHDRPFTGLRPRLEGLRRHHQRRLEETLALCAEPRSAVEVLRGLFRRSLDNHELFFAVGESLAHLHYLMARGVIERSCDAQGVCRYWRRLPGRPPTRGGRRP